MPTRTFLSLVPKLSPNVPNCPQPTLVQNIRDAAIRTCERTLAWRYVQPVFNLLPGIHEYPYSKPMNTDIHVLFGATVNGRPLDLLSLDTALRIYPEWADVYSGVDMSQAWSQQTAGFNQTAANEVALNGGSGFTMPEGAMSKASQPRSITQVTSDKFVILPLPDDAEPYTVRMFYALKPTRHADGMDAHVFDELEQAIFHSALQHLMLMPNVPWTSTELAAYHARQFTRETSERRARANLGNMRGSLVATAPRFV
jgi:hypothetical protein